MTVLLSPVSMLPNWSSSTITGGMPKGCPAIAVDGGCVWITSWLAAAGLTTIVFDGPATRPSPENNSTILAAFWV